MVRTTQNTLLSLLLLGILLLSGCSSLMEEQSSWSAQKFYEEAMSAIDLGDYETAIDLFSKLEARFPYGRYAQQAQLETIHAHFKAEEVDATIAAADRFIRLHPRHTNVDYAHYMKGLAAYNLNPGLLERWGNQDMSERDPKRARESFGYFRELAVRFPKSQYREDSIRRMKLLKENLARYELHVANYSLKRGAFLAAVNRAKYVLENFQRTDSIIPALEMMVTAYQGLGLDDLAKDTQRILTLNRAQTENSIIEQEISALIQQ